MVCVCCEEEGEVLFVTTKTEIRHHGVESDALPAVLRTHRGIGWRVLLATSQNHWTRTI